MSTAITLAGPEHGAQLTALMARYHTEAGLPYDDAHRDAAALPLLDGSPLGAVWLIGPQRAPLGYVMVTFGWSVEHGGMTGWLTEIFIRPSVRKRGIGTEVLHAVCLSLSQVGMRAMHVKLPPARKDMAAFCARAGFAADPESTLMTDRL